jgi:hypothetical protein
MGANIEVKHLDGDGLDYLITQLDERYAHGEPIDLTKYVKKEELADLETDPTVPQHVKDITQNEINKWNDMIDDYDIYDPQNGQMLRYNSITGKWENERYDYRDLNTQPQINGNPLQGGNQTGQSLGLQNKLIEGTGIDINGNTISVDAKLGELDDVNLNCPTDGQGLVYDATNNEWKNGTIQQSGGDMTKAVYDTDNDGIVDKAETLNDGTNSLSATIPELNHVHGVTSDIQTQIDGKANTSHTHTKSDITDFPTIPDELADLADDSTHRVVTDTEKSTWNGKQDALSFDSTPTASSNNPVTSDGIKTALDGKASSGHTHEITDVTDFNVLSPSDGQILKYDGTSNKWVNSTGGGGGSSTLDGLDDTRIVNNRENDILTYRHINGEYKWFNIYIGNLYPLFSNGAGTPTPGVGKVPMIVRKGASPYDWDLNWKNPNEWTLIGTTSGSAAIALPSDFNELFVIVKSNAWNNYTFSIPKLALRHDSAVTDTDVPGGDFFKDGGGYHTGSAAGYHDLLSYLISDQKAKLSSYHHNENSITDTNLTSQCTIYWYYR